MNKHKLPVLGFSLLLLITSCKKTDVQQDSNSPTPVSASISSSSPDWKSITNWSSYKTEKFTTFNTKIEDSTITNAVAASGLVLAFTKNGNNINVLPFQEKGTNDSYWYYQVSKGAISISCDAYDSSESLTATSLKYFVFSPEQLNDLEAKGHSKITLLQLSYEEIVTLLNK